MSADGSFTGGCHIVGRLFAGCCDFGGGFFAGVNHFCGTCLSGLLLFLFGFSHGSGSLGLNLFDFIFGSLLGCVYLRGVLFLHLTCLGIGLLYPCAGLLLRLGHFLCAALACEADRLGTFLADFFFACLCCFDGSGQFCLNFGNFSFSLLARLGYPKRYGVALYLGVFLRFGDGFVGFLLNLLDILGCFQFAFLHLAYYFRLFSFGFFLLVG